MRPTSVPNKSECKTSATEGKYILVLPQAVEFLVGTVPIRRTGKEDLIVLLRAKSFFKTYKTNDDHPLTYFTHDSIRPIWRQIDLTIWLFAYWSVEGGRKGRFNILDQGFIQTDTRFGLGKESRHNQFNDTSDHKTGAGWLTTFLHGSQSWLLAKRVSATTS